jgi:carboxypeptidase Taq
MASAYDKLVERFTQLSRLEHALTFLHWDQLVMMPPGGRKSRAEAIAALTTAHHQKLTDPAVKELLDEAAGQSLSHEQNISVDEMFKAWQRAACLPDDLVSAKSLAASVCEHGWRAQRTNNDWAGFLANFREVVNLSRTEAHARQAAQPGRYATPYDALLDLYCTGESSEFISTTFSELKEKLPPLLTEIVAARGDQTTKLSGFFPIDRQKKLSTTLMTILGFDFTSGRLDESNHPFSTGDQGDQRITTRYRTDEFIDALKATAHETGHAGYEKGLPQKWSSLPIGTACNICIHESQSLLFEKQIFLAKPFLSFFVPTIHSLLPETNRYSADDIWRGAIRVAPGLIRIEADEVSYPLHVILRFEIERDLINGTIEAADIPALWDEKMQAYLGLRTENDYRNGCLQDIHWTDGSFGYFPAYTMGALNGVQLFTALIREQPHWQNHFATGELDFVFSWLHTHIWSRASSASSQQIMADSTGEQTNPAHFLEYVKQRYIDEKF